MAEPTSTVATATAAGLSAAFVAALGVEPQALVYACVGAIFGVAWAPPSNLLRSIWLFVSVVLASALLGTWAAEYFQMTSRHAVSGWSLALAAIFHPLLAAVVQAVPGAISAIVKSRTGGAS